jgi:type IV secretory pathway TrbL component
MAMLVDRMVESKISSWHPIDSLGLIILDLVILLTMCVVAANMLITLCTCWVMIYAGQVLLGFGEKVPIICCCALRYARQ